MSEVSEWWAERSPRSVAAPKGGMAGGSAGGCCVCVMHSLYKRGPHEGGMCWSVCAWGDEGGGGEEEGVCE